MSRKFTNELPSLTPDRDQVEAYKNTRTPTASRANKESHKKTGHQPQLVREKSSGWYTFFTLLIFSLLAIGGWWFYQQDLQTQKYLQQAEQRIQLLEKQLSVTGEEIGESTVVMKVRLENLTKRTEELWEQMDKLWASAWRRNQADITTLNRQSKILSSKLSKQQKQNTNTAAMLKAINQKQTETEFTIGILNEQVQAAQKLKKQIEEIKNNLASIQSKSLSGDKQQIGLASKVSLLDQSHKQLLDRIKLLESQLNNTVQ